MDIRRHKEIPHHRALHPRALSVQHIERNRRPLRLRIAIRRRGILVNMAHRPPVIVPQRAQPGVQVLCEPGRVLGDLLEAAVHVGVDLDGALEREDAVRGAGAVLDGLEEVV